jgi:hypothetical protein
LLITLPSIFISIFSTFQFLKCVRLHQHSVVFFFSFLFLFLFCRAHDFCLIFTEMAESFLDAMIATPGQVGTHCKIFE